MHATVADESRPAEPEAVDAGKDVPLARLEALAVAIDAFLRAGMIEHARPLAAELAAMVQAARGPRATVLSLAEHRARDES